MRVLIGFSCLYRSTSAEAINESFSDPGGESDLSPTKEGAGGRMTRLRARGGVRDRPPIIDEDDDDLFRVAPPIVARIKRAPRKKQAERVERVEKPEKERVERAVVDKERDVTQDETSLYWIVRHSKAAITVGELSLV